MRTITLALCLLLAASGFAVTTHYVLPAAAGGGTGADWTNAMALPASGSLVRGDVYMLGGSDTSYGLAYKFNDAESGTTRIYIYKAVDCAITATAPYCPGNGGPVSVNPASIAGWSAAFGTKSVLVQDSTFANPMTGGTFGWGVCTGYYTIDGVTGSVDPVTGGPNSSPAFGFRLVTPNPNHGTSSWFIRGCTGVTDSNPITVKHMEVGGIGFMPYYPVNKVSCSWDGTNATYVGDASFNFPLGASPSPAIPVTVYDINNSLASPMITSANVSNVTTTNISGDTITFPAAGGNPCPTVTQVALNILPANMIGYKNDTSHSFIGDSWQYIYAHDAGESVNTASITNFNFDSFYLANNRSTPSQHGSIFQLSEPTNATISSNVTISRGFVKNADGTGMFEHLGQATACPGGGACGTLDGLYLIGVTATCDTHVQQHCGTGHQMVGDNGGQTTVKNSYLLNNTCYGASCGFGILAATSTNNVAENNLFMGDATTSGKTANMNIGSGGTHDYNQFIDMVSSASLSAHENQVAGILASSIFTNVATFNFGLVTDLATPAGCTICINNGVDTSGTVAANNTDFYGITRGVSNGWDMGALQLTAAASNYLVTIAGGGNANGKVCTDGATCTDGILNAVSTAGVISGTSTHTFTAGATATLTATATTGAFVTFSGGGCTTSPCTITVNSPLTITATFQLTPVCTLTLAANSLNSPTTVSATTSLTNLSGVGSFWFVFDPLGTTISVCSYPYSGCAAAGQSGNLPYTVSGLYSLGACSNGVCCTGSTAPLNINTGAGSAAH